MVEAGARSQAEVTEDTLWLNMGLDPLQRLGQCELVSITLRITKGVRGRMVDLKVPAEVEASVGE